MTIELAKITFNKANKFLIASVRATNETCNLPIIFIKKCSRIPTNSIESNRQLRNCQHYKSGGQYYL